MSSIPRLAQALEEILGSAADDLARSTGFIQRQRAFSGSQFARTLVFGWLENPHATCDELADFASELGLTISPQGLSARFSQPAVAFFEQLLQLALAQLIAADPVAVPLLARFPAVLLHDSTTISLPDLLAEQFRGCGGSRGRVAAAIKAHLRLELRTGCLEGPLLQDGRAHDRAVGFRRRPEPGSLLVRDLGFFQLDELAAEAGSGRYWLSRLKPRTAIWHQGERVELSQLLEAQQGEQVELAVELGLKQRIACRLLAVRVPQEVAEQRRRRLRKEARDKGQTVGAERLALCEWTILVTNVPAEMLSLVEALVLLKLRWQIEVLFKLWKSHGGVDKLRGRRAERLLVELYAKFLGRLVEHWLLLTGCWQQVERSLLKAAKRVRVAARRLAEALSDGQKLRAELERVVEKMQRAARQARRQKEPNAYRLLLDPSLLPLS